MNYKKSFNRCRPLNGSLKEKLLQFEDGEQLISKLAIGLPAISLVNESSLMTAIANDVDATICFAQQVLALGKPNDVLLCISTSGNSRNVVLAAEVAKCIGAKIVSLIGINSRAKLRDYSDVVISVPYSETYRIQEKHLPIYHLLCNLLEEEFFKK